MFRLLPISALIVSLSACGDKDDDSGDAFDPNAPRACDSFEDCGDSIECGEKGTCTYYYACESHDTGDTCRAPAGGWGTLSETACDACEVGDPQQGACRCG